MLAKLLASVSLIAVTAGGYLVSNTQVAPAGQANDAIAFQTASYLETFIEHPALSACVTERYGKQLRQAGLARFRLEPQAADCPFAACARSRIRGLAEHRDTRGVVLRTALFMDPPKIPIASPLALEVQGERIIVTAPPALPLAAPLANVCKAIAAPLQSIADS
ncbi:hypothetical protein VDS34_17950 [Xanthomonas campestris pv. campestris]|uniref:hypothetical protein n=1 Tax=Xanthomonas campestris TaxID=339 RepID=UPI0025A2DB21|nr:hypothetical protein [Xanthomonas campestris]MDM7672501.1 hypothetical protein [Xanthomonas campestris pv. campestris]MDM7685206.1 hypothetical protein [Xanthomonas campestris pv. campestris]MDM7697606.1 hypothetical protein [Xanthomonas campestris pv. campestris]MDM7868616.1 hypothetical protein [Xanthomonas campestris pv. campestris]MDO0860588.1 hypothetical protein [Xanthomonas campestris pv. campestris]